jgi:hypothetical protein
VAEVAAVSAILDRAALARLDARWGQCEAVATPRKRKGRPRVTLRCGAVRGHRGSHVAELGGRPVFWGEGLQP